MSSFYSHGDLCAVCRELLPDRGNRRVAIPRLGGQKRLVHASCVETIDRQLTLTVEPKSKARHSG